MPPAPNAGASGKCSRARLRCGAAAACVMQTLSWMRCVRGHVACSGAGAAPAPLSPMSGSHRLHRA
eukprot:scaffold8596_cov128-Isochrysis_galbana.AAC.2